MSEKKLKERKKVLNTPKQPCPYATLRDDEGLIPPCTYSSFEGKLCETCGD